MSIDRDPQQVKQFVKEKGMTYPILLDPDLAVAQQYGLRATPTTYLIDKEGNVVGGTIGPKPWDSEAAQQLILRLARR